MFCYQAILCYAQQFLAEGTIFSLFIRSLIQSFRLRVISPCSTFFSMPSTLALPSTISSAFLDTEENM